MLCTAKYYTHMKKFVQMRTAGAIILGLLSGVMLFLLTATVAGYGNSAEAPTPPAAYAALIAGWPLSAWLIRRNALATSTIFCRGFLLGAAEWLAVIPAIHASPEDYRGAPNAVPVVVGEIVIRLLAVAMAAGCGLAFTAAYFIGRSKSRELAAARYHSK